MMIICCDVDNITGLLDNQDLGYTVRPVPKDNTFVITLAPSTKWQDFMFVSMMFGPAEFDRLTNTILIDD